MIPHVKEALFDSALGVFPAIVLVIWIIISAYSEGYRGFQKRFVPRVIARAQELVDTPKPWWTVLLAPAYAMSLFSDSKRQMTISWILVALIAVAVFGMRYVAQPWRGIVDAGVVVGLGWGIVAFFMQIARPPVSAPREWLPRA